MKLRDRRYKVLIRSVFFILFTFSETTMAYSFKPTEQEFNNWPIECKAYYVTTNIGSRSGFFNRVSKQVVDFWRSQVHVFRAGPWHYCEGIARFNRAKLEVGPKTRLKQLDVARKAVKYTWERMPQNHPWYGEMTVVLGDIYKELEDKKSAEKLYNEAIKKFPEYASGHIAYSIFYKDLGNLDKAIEILDSAVELVKPPSSELYYVLGLYSLENKDLAKAEVNAEKAYELGYPLPGLRNRLLKYKDRN